MYKRYMQKKERHKNNKVILLIRAVTSTIVLLMGGAFFSIKETVCCPICFETGNGNRGAYKKERIDEIRSRESHHSFESGVREYTHDTTIEGEQEISVTQKPIEYRGQP